MAQCPAHEDASPSLAVTIDGAKVLLKCMGGCETGAVLDALGLGWGCLFLDQPESGGGAGEARGSRPARGNDALLTQVYGRLLDLLPLTDRHYRHLTGRGFGREWIESARYRSLAFPHTRKAASRLYSEFGEALYLVPGFAPGAGGRPAIRPEDGLLIPVRDRWGDVVGAQVRGEGVKKYRWLANRDGPKAEARCHCAGVADCAGDLFRRGTVVVTEGPLKADAVAARWGFVTLGVAGTGAWSTALDLLPEDGRAGNRIALAFDHDAAGRAAEGHLVEALRGRGHRVAVLDWPGGHKGIDDALLAGAEINDRGVA